MKNALCFLAIGSALAWPADGVDLVIHEDSGVRFDFSATALDVPGGSSGRGPSGRWVEAEVFSSETVIGVVVEIPGMPEPMPMPPTTIMLFSFVCKSPYGVTNVEQRAGHAGAPNAQVLAVPGGLRFVVGTPIPVEPPEPPKPTEIVLTAAKVASARDIEEAIDLATDYGARPGTVTLDSSQGDFVYTRDDRSINLYRPNVILRSLNGAVVANCADGLFFDPYPADNLVVEGITFVAEGMGVRVPGGGSHDGVVLRRNTFRTLGWLEAIGVDQARGWLIEDNTIDAAQGWGLRATDTQGFQVRGNTIHVGEWRVALAFFRAVEVTVTGNALHGGEHGLRLEDVRMTEVSDNEVTATELAAVQMNRVQDITLARNTCVAPVQGILLSEIGAGIQLVNNKVEMRGDNPWIGINLGITFDPSGARAVYNEIGGTTAPLIGIYFPNSSHAEAINNRIRARWQGIRVGGGQSQNSLVNNEIRGVWSSGMAFEGENAGNQVIANRVWTAAGSGAVLVDVGANVDFYRRNDVRDNLLFHEGSGPTGAPGTTGCDPRRGGR